MNWLPVAVGYAVDLYAQEIYIEGGVVRTSSTVVNADSTGLLGTRNGCTSADMHMCRVHFRVVLCRSLSQIAGFVSSCVARRRLPATADSVCNR
jgi:hypothetical protein